MRFLSNTFERYPLHPACAALFPVAALLAANIDKTPISQAIEPALVSVFGAFVLWGVLYLATRVYRASALAASWFLTLFFSYGYFFKLLNESVRHRYLLLLWGVVLVLGIFFSYRFRRFDRAYTVFANTVAGTLLVLSIVQIVSYKIGIALSAPPLPDHIASFNYGTAVSPSALPDMYYIIVDAYASQWSFDNFYKFDISEFTSYLHDRGFYIVPESASNYSKTVYSLSSQLNMEYLPVLLEIDERTFLLEDDPRSNEEKLARLIENNRLLHFMKDRGYYTVHVGSPWTHTITNRYADEVINYQPAPFRSEFSLILYNTTMLEAVTEWLDVLDHRKVHWKRIQHEFDELERIAARPEPTYTFAHLEIPHWPYVFEKDGSFVPASVERNREEKENYIRQVHYLNRMISKMVDRILEQSDTPPIIVLQSDHGSGVQSDYLVLEKTGAERDFQLREGLRNWSAILLPGKTGIVPKNVTPVNVWRVILNAYFDTSLDLLPNRNFYKITDVPGFVDATAVVSYDAENGNSKNR